MNTVTQTAEAPDRNAAPERLELVRQFINTAELDEQTDKLSDLAGLRSWLEETGLLGPKSRVTESDRARTIDFRESLRDILTGHTEGNVVPGTVKHFDAVVKQIPMRLRVDDTGWVRVAAAGRGYDGILAELLARVYEAMEDGSWQRMKACGDDSCRWAFFDNSKNRSAHWCDMAVCGNRAKVMAFRQRHAAVDARGKVVKQPAKRREPKGHRARAHGAPT